MTVHNTEVSEKLRSLHQHGLIIESNLPLSRFTTFRVGGRARYYVRADSLQTVKASVAWARERGVPLLILGGGSNVLVADHGFPGLVLRISLRGVEHSFSEDGVELVVGAGERWHQLVDLAVAQGWGGVECLAGIPGLVGATPIQNVGAYGQEVRETISLVEVFDLTTGDVRMLSNDECSFAYRDSRFKGIDRGRYIILRVVFHLKRDSEPVLRHAELQRQLADRGLITPTIGDVRTMVLELRRRKSMLLNAGDPNARGVGSFFVNPILTLDEFAALQEIAERYEDGRPLPNYDTADGRLKISAAWLIEHAGFYRGYTRGSVGISTKHALALVNRGGATARDVINFAREIRNQVRDRFGIMLIPEPTLIGLSLDEDNQPEGAWAV